MRSYARIDEKPITLREQVYEADYAIILDPTLVKNLNEKVTKLIIVNSNKNPKELGINTKAEVKCIDITKTAIAKMGKPFVNIPALGAFSALTKEDTLKRLEEAITQQRGSKGTILEKNIAAIREVYEKSLQKK